MSIELASFVRNRRWPLCVTAALAGSALISGCGGENGFGKKAEAVPPVHAVTPAPAATPSVTETTPPPAPAPETTTVTVAPEPTPSSSTIEWAKIAPGSTNVEGVILVQSLLTTAGCNPGPEDGVYPKGDSQTKAAIELFQTNKGLQIDGIVHSDTMPLLQEDVAAISAGEKGAWCGADSAPAAAAPEQQSSNTGGGSWENVPDLLKAPLPSCNDLPSFQYRQPGNNCKEFTGPSIEDLLGQN